MCFLDFEAAIISEIWWNAGGGEPGERLAYHPGGARGEVQAPDGWVQTWLFDPSKWLTSNFSLEYHPRITYKGRENKGND